jgi:hypothetical protein
VEVGVETVLGVNLGLYLLRVRKRLVWAVRKSGRELRRWRLLREEGIRGCGRERFRSGLSKGFDVVRKLRIGVVLCFLFLWREG